MVVEAESIAEEEGTALEQNLPTVAVNLRTAQTADGFATILPCCVRLDRDSWSSEASWQAKMGAEEVTVICEGFLEKKVDHRRLPIGPAWKRKYCVLSSDGMRMYRSKAKKETGAAALRTVPLCHIKSVSRLHEDDESQVRYFVLETEQGEVMTFRCRGDLGWVAQIQIQLIHYKNRQDIMRYKHLNSSMQVAENTIQRLRASTPSRNDSMTGMNNYVKEPIQIKTPTRGCRTVDLPNHPGVGIGITVIPLHDGRVVVNRVIAGGPAMRLGVISPRDQIVAANGLRVTSVEMLSEIVRNSPNSVKLIVKPRINKPSPTNDDPKQNIEKENEKQPEYINTAPDAEAKLIFEKGNTKQKPRTKNSPQHFRFS